MELTFPFRNMVISDLLRFTGAYKISDYIDVERKNDPNTATHFNPYLEMYDSALANFENELIQIIETTDQTTIDSYFNTLAQDIGYIKEKISLESLTVIVMQYNAESLARFEKEVNEKTEEYFKSENRKLKHLEEFEGPNPLFLLPLYYNGNVKNINYNFYCIEQSLKYIDLAFLPDIHKFISGLGSKFFTITSKYGKEWVDGKIKTKYNQFIKPILFVEGDLDVCYINRAAVLLNMEELLAKLDIRQRGGWRNLDKLWNIYKTDNWETVPQKKIFLYDCDTEKLDEDNGFNFRRIIPTLSDGLVKRGIENLFSNEILQKAALDKPALLDFTTSSGIKRGEIFTKTEYTIDKEEKTNLCDWICNNGDSQTFENFHVIFDILMKIID